MGKLDDHSAVIRPRSGNRHLINFLQPNRLDQLTELLKPILGRRVRVSVDASSASQADEASSEQAPSFTGGRQAHLSQQDRMAALNLPLVREVQQHFDVTPIAFSKEAPDAGESPDPAMGEPADAFAEPTLDEAEAFDDDYDE